MTETSAHCLQWRCLNRAAVTPWSPPMPRHIKSFSAERRNKDGEIGKVANKALGKQGGVAQYGLNERDALRIVRCNTVNTGGDHGR